MKRFARLSRRLRDSLDARLVLLVLASILILVAIGRPTAALRRDVFRYLFVIDVTQSMNVSDAGAAAVRRIALAKDAVTSTIERLPCGSEVGLAIFTEYRSFVLIAPVEVCANYGVVTEILGQIDWQMAWAARSEVAKGLHSALEAAEQLGRGTHLIFLTDGHEAPPIHPEIRPRYSGRPGEVGGAIIGVGGSTPMPIPHLDREGRVLGYWSADEVAQVDPFSMGRETGIEGGEPLAGVDSSNLADRIARGTEHMSSLRENYLERLAAETELHYYRLDTSRHIAERLIQSRFANPRSTVTNLSWVPALLALLGVLSVYLGRRRPETEIPTPSGVQT